MKLKQRSAKFLKNVGFGFIGLFLSLAFPTLSITGSSLVGYYLSLVSGNFAFGLTIWVITLLLFMSIGITALTWIFKKLPFEN